MPNIITLSVITIGALMVDEYTVYVCLYIYIYIYIFFFNYNAIYIYIFLTIIQYSYVKKSWFPKWKLGAQMIEIIIHNNRMIKISKIYHLIKANYKYNL